MLHKQGPSMQSNYQQAEQLAQDLGGGRLHVQRFPGGQAGPPPVQQPQYAPPLQAPAQPPPRLPPQPQSQSHALQWGAASQGAASQGAASQGAASQARVAADRGTRAAGGFGGVEWRMGEEVPPGSAEASWRK